MIKKKIITGLFGAGLLFGFVPVVALAGGSFFIDDVTSYVGIGNTTPAARLDVSGAMYSRMVTATTSAISWGQGNVQSLTLTSNPTLTFLGGQAGGEYDLILNQDSTGGRSVTWPSSAHWPSGVAPTLTSTANSTDEVNFVYDGTNYLGSYNLDYLAQSSPPALNGTPVNGGGTSTSSPSVQITVNSSLSNSLLVTICSYATFGSDDIIDAKANGTSMSSAITYKSSSNMVYDVFYQYAPSSGTYPIKCDYSSAHAVDIYSFVVTGAKQSGFPDAHNETNIGNVTNDSLSLTTVANNTLVIDFTGGTNNTTGGSGGAGQTQNFYFGTSAATNWGLSTYITKSTAGSITTTQSWTSGAGGNAVYANFSIAPN